MSSDLTLDEWAADVANASGVTESEDPDAALNAHWPRRCSSTERRTVGACPTLFWLAHDALAGFA